jgi:hypothetical protein
VLVLGMLVWSPTAGALTEHAFVGTFGEACSAEPCLGSQLKEPMGLAVNDTTHDVYVVDRAGGRVVQFDSSGAFISEFSGAASPAGSFSSPTFVAVDNSGNPLDPSAGDVYVLDAGHIAIDKFDASGTYLGQIVEGAAGSPFAELDGVDVDSSGRLWVYQSNGEIDDFSDALVNEFITNRGSPFGTAPGFAVDGEGHLYVNRGAEVVAQLEEDGTSLIEELDNERTTAAAVDVSSNEVYIDNVESIARFDTSGSLIERFGAGHLAGSSGVAVDAVSGAVYASQPSGEIVEFGAVVVPDATTSEAEPGETSATLNGLVNPDGLEVSSCEFEYGTSTEYGASVPCSQSSAEIGTGSSPVAVSAAVTGLEPRQTYHFRLKVGNANGTSHGRDASFITPSKPIVEDESVLEANANDATLAAKIDPGGRHTTYTVEYGPDTSYGSAAPVPSASAGAGLTAVAVSVQLDRLLPATTYHFRFVASNKLGSTDGADEAFTTAPPAAPLSLPDGRSWEMVSPSDKHGGAVAPVLLEGQVKAASGGEAFTFMSEQSLFEEAHGSPVFAQVLARRSPGGWIAEDIAPSHDSPSGQGVGQGFEYRLFSSDLSHAAVEPFGPFTPLSPETTERTPYLRDDDTGDFTPLLTTADVTNGTKFEGDPTKSQGPVHVLGGTPDLARVVLKAEGPVPLTTPPTNGGLYEWSAGSLQLLSVLPDDKTPVPGELGFAGKEMRHAISADGSRVFWEGESTVEGVAATHLFLRQTVKGETLQIDVPAAGASGAGVIAPVFQGASADGSKVFFTDEQALTEGATASLNSPDLYVCEVVEREGKLACELTDLTVPVVGEAAEVKGFVLGISDDGSSVYLVAHGVLSEQPNEHRESAESGANNLYALHEQGGRWTPTFVASLSSEEENEWTELDRMSARVSPNGRYLAFMSQRSLTGYDNADVHSGVADEEVFLYDAQGTPHLRCPSCAPTGARPAGVLEQGTALNLVDHNEDTWSGHTLAATVPTWEQLTNGADPVYQSRYLSNSGRLFFNSADELVPQDANKQWDVYEFEPPSVGSCTSAGETYSARSSGCVSLISPGTSSQESAFLDASESGGDVFFITAAKLSNQDVDEQLDVYDAHECGLSPCIVSPPQGGPGPCASAETCRSVQLGEAPVGPPSSETLTGDGNVKSPGAQPSAPKRLTRAQLLARALKACRRKPKRARAKCRALAERRYGPHAARKRAHKAKGHASTDQGRR